MTLRIFCCLVAWLIGATVVQAQDSRTIRLVVPYGAGGTSDMVGRALQQSLQQRINRSVIVENKPGATGTIAARMVATSAADGASLLIPNSANTIAPLLQEKQPFDYLTSLAPVSLVATSPMVVLASQDTPASNIREFIAYAKANPGKVNYGATGFGSFGHLAAELIQKEASIQLFFIPYQSGSQVNVALAQGDIKMSILSVPDARTALNMGRGIKALAVTSAEPTSLMPGVPTLAETIPGIVVEQNFSVLAPFETPSAIIRYLADAIKATLEDPTVRQQYLNLGVNPASSTPERMGELMKADYAKWGPIIKSLDNIQKK